VVDALHVIERELMALQKSEQLAEAMVEKLLAKERASDGRDASEVP
jgi:hypothetical protein